MKIKLLVLAITVCMIATPARADLFGFTVSNALSSYDGALYTADVGANSSATLYRSSIPPTGTAFFFDWAGTADFTLTMAISGVTATSADGLGSFTFTDVDGDTITAALSGTWTKTGSGGGDFSGDLTNVLYNPSPVTDTTFDGNAGSVSMAFSAPLPWSGNIIELTTDGTWFDSTYTDEPGSSIIATAVPTPVPAAVLLGMLGLGVAGLKLRKHA